MLDDPLVAPPPPEVPLTNAPLVRVIAQVRFPLVVAVEQNDFVAPFHEAVRARYPVLRREQTQGVLLGPGGVTAAPPQTAWRFADMDGHWRASLTADFLALETTSYTSRSDFLSRLQQLLAALDEHVEPKLIDRLGLRYVDRIVGPAVAQIAKLVKPEVRGISGTALDTHAQHTLSESLFAVDDARLLARWGRLPAGATIDPAAIEPVDQASWILDLDMFSAAPVPFSADRALQDARRFAERIYTFFRWAVTDDFLRQYGGNL